MASAARLRDVGEQQTLQATFRDHDELERLAVDHGYAPYTITNAHTGLTAVMPPDVGRTYAPLGLRAVAALGRSELAWTYLADPCVYAGPALVGVHQVLPTFARAVKFAWHEGWVAHVPREVLTRPLVDALKDAESVTESPDTTGRRHVAAPVGAWLSQLNIRVWAPILSHDELIRRLGLAEEYHRLAVRGLEVCVLTRDRLIRHAAQHHVDHATVAATAGLTRRRVDQILAQQNGRPLAGALERQYASVSPDQLIDQVRQASADVAAKRERQHRAAELRRTVVREAHAAGQSYARIARYIALSKPRVQQLCADGPVRTGPLTLMS